MDIKTLITVDKEQLFGWTEEQILDSYPSISSNSLRAVFFYLKDCIQQE